MPNCPDPKDYDTKSEYMAAVRDRLDYGFCNPRKITLANEDERDAERRWDEHMNSEYEPT